MNNSDYIVQENEPEYDRDCLHRKLFVVNMRIFKSSKQYQDHILGILDYMEFILAQKWEDYKSNSDGGTYGISGANLAIPYNIIAYRNDNSCHFMLNPIIKNKSKETKIVLSNCGSIKLKEKIPVRRFIWVEVEFYDKFGEFHTQKFVGKQGGYTIQHEIDHNNGILITDKIQSDDVSLKGRLCRANNDDVSCSRWW